MFIITIFLLIHFFEKETKIAQSAIFVSFIKKDDQKTNGFLISFFLYCYVGIQIFVYQ